MIMETKEKKLLLVTGIYPPDIGGPATYCHLLSQELPHRGWQVGVLSFGEVRHWPKIIRHIIFFFKVLNQARAYRVIYAQDPVSVGLPVCLACFFSRRDFILKVVGDYAWEQGSQRFGVEDSLDDFSLQFKKYSWMVRLLKLIETGVAKRAQRIIVPSLYLKKIVSNWGVSADKIKVIYNSIEDLPILDTKDGLKKALSFNYPTLVSVGRLVPWKGFGLLIEIMPEIIKSYPQAKLYIIGSGPEREKLGVLIQALNLESAVCLVGQLPRVEVLRYLKASDVFLLNTNYEGFSHQLLEVAQCHTPIITTRVGGNSELITDRVNGRLVDYNDKESLVSAIIDLLAKPDQTENYCQQAEKRLTLFTKNLMLANLEQELL